MNQCTTESRNQWINVINWFHESTKQWISESLSQWINEWTLQQFRFKSSVNQVNQWVDESRNQRIDESMNQCFNDSMNQWITESMNAATNESMNEEIWPISSSKIAPIPQFFANFKWNWRILYEIDLPRQNCAHFASFIVQQCSDPFSFFLHFFQCKSNSVKCTCCSRYIIWCTFCLIFQECSDPIQFLTIFMCKPSSR